MLKDTMSGQCWVGCFMWYGIWRHRSPYGVVYLIGCCALFLIVCEWAPIKTTKSHLKQKIKKIWKLCIFDSVFNAVFKHLRSRCVCINFDPFFAFNLNKQKKSHYFCFKLNNFLSYFTTYVLSIEIQIHKWNTCNFIKQKMALDWIRCILLGV